MNPRHPDICLVSPAIPQNTGNIGRLAAVTQCRLHLIEPLGFTIDEKRVRRSGLDYWPYLKMKVHPDFDAMLSEYESPPSLAFLSTKGTRPYTDIPQDTQILVFGRETSGLPESLRERYPEHFYNIPMYHPEVRSLNLANSVSIVVYDVLRRIHHQKT